MPVTSSTFGVGWTRHLPSDSSPVIRGRVGRGRAADEVHDHSDLKWE
jgi:hypothetical protein